jgi:hypothetical protein
MFVSAPLFSCQETTKLLQEGEFLILTPIQKKKRNFLKEAEELVLYFSFSVFLTFHFYTIFFLHILTKQKEREIIALKVGETQPMYVLCGQTKKKQ